MTIVPDPISRDCRSDYPALHQSGERRVSAIRYIVLHATEGGSAEGVARYFESPDSGGSSNLVVDDFRCYRCLGDNLTPWGAPPLNLHGFHIEQCGFSSWPAWRWQLHRMTIRRAAYKAALRCKWYSIPPRELGPAQLKRDFGVEVHGGVPAPPGPMRGGILTHATISETYHESDHSDPGAGYPMAVFIGYLTGYLGADAQRLLDQHPLF